MSDHDHDPSEARSQETASTDAAGELSDESLDSVSGGVTERAHFGECGCTGECGCAQQSL